MRTAAAVLAFFLFGCGFTPEGDALRNAVKQYGAAAYDEGLENAEWWICTGASVGAIQRRYGRSLEVWKQFCGDVRAF